MRRRGHERGATLIEASLVMPIMIMIMIGTMELGLAFKDYLTVSFAGREAARVGALAGNDSDADCHIITAAMDGLGGRTQNLVGIQIFQADPDTGARLIGKTNTWVLAGTDPYDCANDWTITEKWPATTRETAFGPTSELDIIGVRIGYTHNWITGFPPFNGSFMVDEQTITRMEPESFE